MTAELDRLKSQINPEHAETPGPTLKTSLRLRPGKRYPDRTEAGISQLEREARQEVERYVTAIKRLLVNR